MVCCFDGDQAGRAAAWKALENALPTLNEHRLIKVVFLPDGEDPDSLIRSQGKAGFLRFIDNAMPGLEFLFQRLSQGLDLSSVDGRARLAGLVAPYLNKVPEGYLRTLLEQKLRELTGLDARASSARRMPTDVRSTLNNRTQKVSDRLLTLLLKQPEIWLKVDAADRSRLFLHRGDLGLLGELASYIDTHPEADIEEILVHWSDEPSYEELLQRAQTVLEIESGVILGEFKEGVVRLTEILEQQARRRALTALKENPDVEGLRQFMALRKP